MTRLFDANEQNISDLLLSDFTVPLFRDAFKQYFTEMGIVAGIGTDYLRK